ncbi:DUF6879 family protein [Actinocrispum wychmicini]|uniref:DUF6879 domain-containing protein n=1 Tax=Actinocrispum wychmicini TaxID=1213861 RepID=A0A4R2K856_9PSEU|nr:DUF6879 family protein [Actinocrispum wychmicini]TCO62555.1 hypothetical protein EV192_102694 [Actinocrispum wychmicini]
MSVDKRAYSVPRKILITMVVGALLFPLTNLLLDSTATKVLATVVVGAVVLIVQFLVDLQRQLRAIEGTQIEQISEVRRAVDDTFAKISPATELFGQAEATGLTELVARASAIDRGGSSLVSRFAQVELHRMSYFLNAMIEREAFYDGEDREWLLALTRSTDASIDAISVPKVDADGAAVGFWRTDLGLRYLSLQHEAIVRGVRVRRIFVLQRPELVNDPDLLSVVRAQAELGIDVRVLHPPAAASAAKVIRHDITLFDNALSYEVVPVPGLSHEKPLILYTRLAMREDVVNKHIERYQQLWATAVPPAAGDDGEFGTEVTVYTSADDGEPLRDAVVELLDVAGFDVHELSEPARGSWFQRLSVRRRDSRAMEKLSALAGKVERAAELKYIDAPRSETDEREAKAIAKLADAMAGVDEVVIRTSHVLFVKTSGRLVSWVLTENEIRMLHENPQFMRSPHDLMAALDKVRFLRHEPARELAQPLRCPTCGHSPAEAQERWRLRRELTIAWLHPSPDCPGEVVERRHCRQCQPRSVQPVVCPLCGDGPMITGGLADHPPGAVQSWLLSQGWHQSAGGDLVCAAHTRGVQ